MATILLENGQRNVKVPQRNVQTIGNYLLDRLYILGLDHIFGIPGDYVLRLDKVIEEHPIHFINSTGEDKAGYSADAYAHMRGIGAACITYGVGINILNAVAQAFVEGFPLIVISGAPASKEYIKNHYLHHLINQSHTTLHDQTQMNLFKQITIDQAILDDPKTAADEIDRVINNCILQAKPVYIEIPRDMVDAPINQHHIPAEIKEKTNDPQLIKDAMHELENLLNKSKRPLLWLGQEIQIHGLQKEIMQFIEKYDIPFTTTFQGKSLFSERHPLYIGLYQGAVSRPEVASFFNECDLIILIGSFMSDVNTGFFSDAFDKINHATITTTKIDMMGHQYNEAIFQDLLKSLSEIKINHPFEYPSKIPVRQLVPFEAKANTKLTTARLFECLQDKLSQEHIFVADVGDCLFGSVDLVLEQDSFVASSYFGALGSGIPACIGAQIAVPERRCVLLVGDGGFQMSATEISTIAKYALNVIVIILNNHGYGTERPLLEGIYNEVRDWKYTLFTELVGYGKSFRANTEEDFNHAMSQAFEDRNHFYLIEADVDKTDFSPTLKRFLSLATKN